MNTLFPPTAIDFEDRPYHLGWILYAWPPIGRRMAARVARPPMTFTVRASLGVPVAGCDSGRCRLISSTGRLRRARASRSAWSTPRSSSTCGATRRCARTSSARTSCWPTAWRSSGRAGCSDRPLPERVAGIDLMMGMLSAAKNASIASTASARRPRSSRVSWSASSATTPVSSSPARSTATFPANEEEAVANLHQGRVARYPARRDDLAAEGTISRTMEPPSSMFPFATASAGRSTSSPASCSGLPSGGSGSAWNGCIA